MNKLISLLTLSFLISANALIGQIKFQYSNFEYSKNMAEMTQKPFFIYFAEPGCRACKEMNQTTFQSRITADAVNGKMGAYKAMVNSTTGKRLAEKFSVFETPTFLFFDKDANLVQRIAQPMTADDLRIVAANPSVFTEMKGEFAVIKEEYTVGPEGNVSKPIAQPVPASFETEPMDVPANMEVVETAAMNETVSVPSTDVPAPSAVESYDLVPEAVSSGSFTLQMGAFSNARNADKMVRDLLDSYGYSVNIRTIGVNGKIIHRVMLGDFEDEYSANKVYKAMRNDGRKAFVKRK